MSLKVCAKNFHLYPELEGVTDENVLKSIIKLIDNKYPITTTARNVDFEFYWEKKNLTVAKLSAAHTFRLDICGSTIHLTLANPHSSF